MGVAYKKDFSQMRPSRFGFDSESGAFHVHLILNEFKFGFI